MKQEELFVQKELPNNQIVKTLNNHHDQLEALLDRLLRLEEEVVNLRGRKWLI